MWALKRKYRRRFDRRQSLIKAKEAHPDFAERYANMDFKLPEPPRLPSGTLTGGGTGTLTGRGK